MDVRRRPLKTQPHHRPVKPTTAGELAKASDALPLPLPLYLTNTLFFTIFFSVMYFLLLRWREKIRNSIPLHVLTSSELAAVASLIASVIYLHGFFGIDFVQSIIRPSPDSWEIEHEHEHDNIKQQPTMIPSIMHNVNAAHTTTTHEKKHEQKKNPPLTTDPSSNKDEEIVKMVVGGSIPSYKVENATHTTTTHEKKNLPPPTTDPSSNKDEEIVRMVVGGSTSSYGLENATHTTTTHEKKNLPPPTTDPSSNKDEEIVNMVVGGSIPSNKTKNATHTTTTHEKKKNPPPTTDPSSNKDEEIVKKVVGGSIPSYGLESKLGDCKRTVLIRRAAVEQITGRSLTDLPVDGFDYDSILGQCCEMPVGYVQIPVGIVGPLVVNGREFSVPMATTEGCLVASTNRGCKAIHVSGGATCLVLRDGMTRAPVVRFGSAKRAAELKRFVEDPVNFDTLAVVFNKSSRFGRLQTVKCAIAGKNLYVRFCCATGDAMGMNMVSKGVQNVLDFLHVDFPDMDVMGISGNYCSDKKPAAVNWIEGRGKSVVCEAVIRKEVVQKVLKTTVSALVELNMLKNLTGSAMAGALGGFNAQASNIVSAVYLATGQDPAQNVESSHCITMMEAVNDGKDLHISVTMPSIEVGTVGGGTQLASQSACLNLLGVKGASKDEPGSNSRLLATIVAGSVLAGELSLMSAISAGQLVKSHMKYNRSTRDMTQLASS